MKAKDFEYYKAYSLYLNPANRNSVNGGVMLGNVDDLTYHLNQVKPKIGALTKLLDQIEVKFEQAQKYQLQMGAEPIEVLPLELQIEEAEIEAQIKVHEAEVKWLEENLKEAKELNQIVDEQPILPRSQWGSAVLKNGVMQHIGGHKTKVDQNLDPPMLVISDKRSPYDGMKVWEFKSKIANPMGHEFRYRQRMETKNALAEKREPKKVHWPLAPTWNAETGVIEFPAGYSKSTIKKYSK